MKLLCRPGLSRGIRYLCLLTASSVPAWSQIVVYQNTGDQGVPEPQAYPVITALLLAGALCLRRLRTVRPVV